VEDESPNLTCASKFYSFWEHGVLRESERLSDTIKVKPIREKGNVWKTV
jgi:hypothetical protein